MKRTVAALIAMAVIAGPMSPVFAKGPDHCPPGLAKKSPACVPPGLAKKQYHGDDRHYHSDGRYDDDHYHYRRYEGDNWRGDYRIGDRLPDWYDRVGDPRDYGLQVLVNGSDYYVRDGVIYRVNTETREVLELFEAVGAVLN